MTTQIIEQILKKDKDDNIISKLAILRNLDTEQLNKDLDKYCGKTYRNVFVDKTLLDPWTRLVISGINDLKYDNLETYKILSERRNKLNEIIKNNPD